jgi:hypothetical protein
VQPARSALIVAADEYADPKLRRLRAPVRDAEELGRVLADEAIGGFDVEVVLNEPEHRVRRRLAHFFTDRRRDDLLLVHFSCHGLKDDDGTLYFATPDTELEHLDSTAVPSDFLNRQMGRSRSRRIALFLDCCYSGAFSRGAIARAGQGVDLADRFNGRGQVVITASNSMEYAFEGDELTGEGAPSVFTTALVEGLATGDADRDGDDLVSVDELYDYVYDRVRETTPSQTPSKWTYDLQGDLYIARNPNPRPASPLELPGELRTAIESPLAGVRLGAVAELERVLAGTSVRLATAARLALESLGNDDSRSVSEAALEALGRPVAGEAQAAARAPHGDDPADRHTGPRARGRPRPEEEPLLEVLLRVVAVARSAAAVSIPSFAPRPSGSLLVAAGVLAAVTVILFELVHEPLAYLFGVVLLLMLLGLPALQHRLRSLAARLGLLAAVVSLAVLVAFLAVAGIEVLEGSASGFVVALGGLFGVAAVAGLAVLGLAAAVERGLPIVPSILLAASLPAGWWLVATSGEDSSLGAWVASGGLAIALVWIGYELWARGRAEAGDVSRT